MFLFIGAFVDRAIGEKRGYPMTRVHMMFSELKQWLRRKDGKEIVSDKLLGFLE